MVTVLGGRVWLGDDDGDVSLAGSLGSELAGLEPADATLAEGVDGSEFAGVGELVSCEAQPTNARGRMMVKRRKARRACIPTA